MKEPPTALVQTWFDMMMQKDSVEIRNCGKTKLKLAFGSNEKVMQALVKHKIIKGEYI